MGGWCSRMAGLAAYQRVDRLYSLIAQNESSIADQTEKAFVFRDETEISWCPFPTEAGAPVGTRFHSTLCNVLNSDQNPGRCPQTANSGRQVVHEQKGIRPVVQGRHQHLLGEGQKHGAARCDSDAHRRHHAVQRKRADHGQSLPVAMRNLADRPLPARGPAVAPGQAGVDPGLIDEDEASRVDPGQLGTPPRPRLGDILPVLLGRPECLFLRTKPRLFSARQTAARLRRTPVRAASRSAYSASVASFCSSTSLASAAIAPPTSPRLRAGTFGPRRPSLRAACSQRDSVRSPIRKRRATSAWLPSPASQAASARSRRSGE